MKPGQRVGRKERCPCGSGRQYGKCCYARDIAEAKQHRNRVIYYFHIQHGADEMPGRYATTDDIKYHNGWDEIERTLDCLPTPNKVYNDSIKKSRNEGVIEEIPPEALIQFLSKQPDTRNYRLLKSLAKRGTVLVACESEDLHREQFDNQAMIDGKYGPAGLVSTDDMNSKIEIMRKRNVFIAGQIDNSLEPGEVGLLLLGHSHNYQHHMENLLTTLENLELHVMNECKCIDDFIPKQKG